MKSYLSSKNNTLPYYRFAIVALSVWSMGYMLLIQQRVGAQMLLSPISFKTIDIILPESDEKSQNDLLVEFSKVKDIEGIEIILTDDNGVAVDSKPVDKSGKVLFKKLDSSKSYALIASESVYLEKLDHQWLLSISSGNRQVSNEDQDMSTIIKVINMQTGRVMAGIPLVSNSSTDHTKLNIKYTDLNGQAVFERLNTSRDFKVTVESNINDELSIIYLNDRKITPIKRITAI